MSRCELFLGAVVPPKSQPKSATAVFCDGVLAAVAGAQATAKVELFA